jgi:purine nucleosidase
VDWEATLAHGFAHADFEKWLVAGDERARFYDSISRHTRAWAGERRGANWHSADALAMAVALEPERVQESAQRAVAVELTGARTRGATVVDWLQRGDRPAQARIVQRYDQSRFEALVRRALGIGKG